MPVQLAKHDAAADGPTTSHAMEVEGMWPYWLDGRDASTVRNDLKLDSMVILTGDSKLALPIALGCGLKCGIGMNF